MAVIDRALLSLEDVKNYLEIDSDDTSQDTLLEALINSATKVFERHCGCYFVENEVATADAPEKHDGTGTDEVMTDYWPIRTITQVRSNPYTGTAQTLASTDYLLYASEGRIKLRTDTSTITAFGRCPQEIEIAYKAGYCADTDSVPEDVKEAARQQVAIWRRDKAGDLTTERIADHTWQRSPAWREPTNLSEQVKYLLDPYVHRRMA